MDINNKLADIADRVRSRREKALSALQVEFWPDEKRAAPNSMLRCALFRGALATKNGTRKLHRNTEIPSLGREQIFYSGDDLDQKDMDVWMAVLQLFRERPVGETIHTSSNNLLKLAGLQNSGKSHQALRDRLDRLTFAHIQIKSSDPESKYSFHGSLLQRAERTSNGSVWEISLAPRLKLLFTHGYTWVDWEIRSYLNRAPLSQWLHSFYRSHRDPIPFTITKLHELCGSQTKELRFFRNDLKKSMVRLQEACEKYGVTLEWQHDKKSDRLTVNWATKETHKRLK
jgi:hypothetical protein